METTHSKHEDRNEEYESSTVRYNWEQGEAWITKLEKGWIWMYLYWELPWLTSFDVSLLDYCTIWDGRGSAYELLIND